MLKSTRFYFPQQLFEIILKVRSTFCYEYDISNESPFYFMPNLSAKVNSGRVQISDVKKQSLVTDHSKIM